MDWMKYQQHMHKMDMWLPNSKTTLTRHAMNETKNSKQNERLIYCNEKFRGKFEGAICLSTSQLYITFAFTQGKNQIELLNYKQWQNTILGNQNHKCKLMEVKESR